MTSEQIRLVRTSFERIKPLVEETAVLFYARLFEMDPTLRRLFKIDIREQGHKLMQILGYAVDNLDRLDDLIPTLRELGARHVEYGVKDENYDTVGVALLWTLEKALKTDYTAETNEAWTAVYRLLADSMKGTDRQSTTTSSPGL
jgi:hemoglobin-like flavoprotein